MATTRKSPAAVLAWPDLSLAENAGLALDAVC